MRPEDFTALKAIVGDGRWISDVTELEPRVTEWRGIGHGSTPLLLKPADTAEVSAVLAYCNDNHIGVVPQGGNTGLCGGAIPDSTNTQIILSLERLNRIRHVDADNFSMTVEAGCVLSTLQDVAREHDRVFPLSLAAEGSCQIGGNLSTDAGGINVIRYGTAREQVLGLEVVLADGEIVDGLRALRKDTAGYRLAPLFLGSEGTLGVITAASLKLYPDTGEPATALVALNEAADAVRLLSVIRSACGDVIEAFELISATAIEFVERHMHGVRSLPDQAHPWYVLLELRGAGAEASLENTLMQSLDEGLVLDVIVATSRADADGLWHIRHSISEAQKFEGASLKHDIAVPISQIPELLRSGDALIDNLLPGGRLCCFGHVGDGNLHYNVSQPPGADEADFRARGEAFTGALYRLVRSLGGTFSAEHGVGAFKKDVLPEFRSEAEIALMWRLKRALDPNNILNPGKVLPTGSASGRLQNDIIDG